MNDTSANAAQELTQSAYDMLTAEDDGRVCKDIPDSLCNAQPRNFLTHVIALTGTKLGDGLADPKLVLPWLLTTLGAPAALLGLLVPLREAGALLPQLFIAERIRAMPHRKWVWAAGSIIQGLCVIGMGLSALTLEGTAAGLAIVGLLAVFSCARSLCSVSYKDVLGKTVARATRGTATGTAASVAAGLLLAFGVALSLGWIPRTVTAISACLFAAGGLWMAAAMVFSTLAEEAGATGGGGNPIAVVREQFGLLARDGQLLRFIVVRGLLTATAMAPPFMLALAGRNGSEGFGTLGPMVLASATAGLVSGYVWGRLSDRSSRLVLVGAGVAGAIILAAAGVLALAAPDLYRTDGVAPGLLFALVVAYQGVRLGRSTHIVDMAAEGDRAAYTALSNTIIGVVLLAGGIFGVLAQYLGEAAVLLMFAAMSAIAAAAGLGLDEVQR